MKRTEGKYNPKQDGAIDAIRIFYDETFNNMAELAFAFGGSEIICWTNVKEREPYLSGISGYTIIYDERIESPVIRKFEKKQSFSDFVKDIIL